MTTITTKVNKGIHLPESFNESSTTGPINILNNRTD